MNEVDFYFHDYIFLTPIFSLGCIKVALLAITLINMYLFGLK